MEKLMALFTVLLMATTVLAVEKADDLTKVFDQYNTVAAAGDINKALAFRTAKVKKEILAEIKQPEQKEDFKMMLKAMAPVSYTVDHVARGKSSATVYLTGTYRSMDPKQAGKTGRMEVQLDFQKEAGSWKIGDLLILGDPDAVKRSADQNFEPEDAYNADKTTNLSGRIVSVKFGSEYTLVTIRMLDEEQLVFLPSKAVLEKSGFKTASLVPWKMLEAEGYPHKNNKFKVWATSASVLK